MAFRLTILTILICLILTLPIITKAFDFFLKSKLRWRKTISNVFLKKISTLLFFTKTSNSTETKKLTQVN